MSEDRPRGLWNPNSREFSLPMTDPRNIRLRVPVITRLEGEGALELYCRDERLERAVLRIFEPPRFFEKFLEGKHYSEQPIIAARICGICPIAYQMTGVRAIERALGIEPSEWIGRMRRVLQCGEWLQSHALHIHFLALPDFLGYGHMLDMARDHPEAVKRGLRLQALGNDLISLSGGRSVHPVGLRVGGFHSAPEPAVIAGLVARLDAALADAEALVRWASGLDLPDDHATMTCVALHHPSQYAMNEGRVLGSDGLEIDAADYRRHFQEHQEPHSTALYSLLDGQPYLVGPLARMNLNFAQLPGEVRDLATDCGLRFPSDNIYHSLLARALECYFAVFEARRLLAGYQAGEPFVQDSPRAGWGAHCTEAPRGLIYHHYGLDSEGFITEACIIPPTSQNQARIESDLMRGLTAYGLEHSDQELQFFAERLIRNYDPCISCSVHFLDLRVHRN
ncbi:Ni/Fe hydrogenase subunit alpha [Marinobacterium nitratireducens]|uniref:Ni/Fe hydrogenase subunit alpha n=1 Tax=Marinobacterium nitratireducens TaxID=518897 RepID=A0A918DXA7_9GAMM|nr:nickel-dependent hydrogenase large subunit [Marinobacterium nitratireducens]GGO86940.1 Ni/Fe hydrogenase subunit alpha [Marinobacterium nitratireducens]